MCVRLDSSAKPGLLLGCCWAAAGGAGAGAASVASTAPGVHETKNQKD
jgi:hypothetical protein